MSNPGAQAFGQQSRTKHRATIVEHLDEITRRDPTCAGIFRVQPQDPVIVSVNKHPMIGNIVQEAVLAIPLGVEAVTRMRRDQLQRIRGQFRNRRTFPGGGVFNDRGSLGIIGRISLEARALEFELA